MSAMSRPMEETQPLTTSDEEATSAQRSDVDNEELNSDSSSNPELEDSGKGFSQGVFDLLPDDARMKVLRVKDIPNDFEKFSDIPDISCKNEIVGVVQPLCRAAREQNKKNEGSTLFKSHIKDYTLTDKYMNEEVLLKTNRFRNEKLILIKAKTDDKVPKYPGITRYFPSDLVRCEYYNCGVADCEAKTVFHYFENEEIWRYDMKSYKNVGKKQRGISKSMKEFLEYRIEKKDLKNEKGQTAKARLLLDKQFPAIKEKTLENVVRNLFKKRKTLLEYSLHPCS
jgi:hypothetical protein